MMTERQLKYRAGTVLVLSHLGVLLLIIVLRLMNGFNGDEFTTLLALVTPMFSGYSTAIIAFIVMDRHVTEDKSQKVTLTFVIMTLLIPTVLAIIVAVSIWIKAHNLAFADFEDFKRFLIALESIFAVYVGMLIYALFPRQTVDAAKKGSKKT